MTTTPLPDWWDTVTEAFVDHISDPKIACSYGGLAMANWYWMIDPACPRPHGTACAVDGHEQHLQAVRWRTGQMPTDPRHDDVEMWEVILCPVHLVELQAAIGVVPGVTS